MDRIPERIGSTELKSVGLSEPEGVVYEALVDRGPAPATDLRATTPGGPARLTRTLAALETKGLISRIPGRPVRYAAVPPEVGLELLLVHREEELRRARLAALDLAERFHQGKAGRDVSGLLEIVSGDSVVRERYIAVHRSAREQLRVMSRPPYVMGSDATRAISTEAHEKKVRSRNILDRRYFEEGAERRLASIREDIAAGEEHRVMAKVPLKLTVADDRVAIIPLEIRPGGIQSAVLFHASALLESLIEVFDTCWALAYPLDITSGDEQSAGRAPDFVSAHERELLALLAAGIPDRAMARQLGVSHTTLQRRMLDLKTRLGVTTRFQAGLQTALRGWITDAGGPLDGPA